MAVLEGGAVSYERGTPVGIGCITSPSGHLGVDHGRNHHHHYHPGGNPGGNLQSISHRCHLREVAFVWELTKQTIDLPLGCLQGGISFLLHSHVNLEWRDKIKLSKLLLPRKSGTIKSLHPNERGAVVRHACIIRSRIQ